MKLVLVEWIDSYGCGTNWETVDDMMAITPHYCKSVGWIVKETDEMILVVPHISPDNGDIGAKLSGCGDMAIPVCSIRFMMTIEVNNCRVEER